MQQLYPLFIALPLATVFIILLMPTRLIKTIETIVATSYSILLIMSFSLIGHESFTYHIGGWAPPFGITLVSDSLSTLLMLIISTIGFACIVFSFYYMEQYTSIRRFYALFLLLTTGLFGVVTNGDLFNLYVFIEISTLSSYALVAFGVDHEELEAAFKYSILGSVSSALLLMGISISYAATGTVNLADMANFISTHGMNKALYFADALFIMGFGLKAAMVPFHAWLPDAHPSAPAPVSAMLSGVLIKACGVYPLIRIFYNVTATNPVIHTILMSLGLLSMVVGVLLAVGQWDLKRLLAYHSISQMGYVVLGIGLGTPLGILGGLFHLMNHAIFKSLLFLCSGAIEFSTGTRQLKEMGGLFKRMPVTSTACSIASLSISGIPPFNGFWSKLIIIIALVQAHYYLLAAITVAVSFLTLVSFVKVQRYALFGKLPEALKNVREVPMLMKSSLVFLALLCIAAGIFYPLFGEQILQSAREVVLNKDGYIQLVLQLVNR